MKADIELDLYSTRISSMRSRCSLDSSTSCFIWVFNTRPYFVSISFWNACILFRISM